MVAGGLLVSRMRPDSRCYSLQAHDVDLESSRDPNGLQRMRSLATQVIPGGVPAIAWRVSIGGRIIAFSGDSNGDNGNLHASGPLRDLCRRQADRGCPDRIAGNRPAGS